MCLASVPMCHDQFIQPEDMGQYGGQALKLMFGAMWATAASTTSRRLAVKGRYTCKLHTQTDSVFSSGHYLCSV